MLKEIQEKLKEIESKKDKIKFLVDRLNNTKDEKLKEQIQELINELIKEENLEERIEIKQQQVQVPIRKFEKDIEQERTPKTTKQEETTDLPEVSYQARASSNVINYQTQVRDLSASLETSNPLRRELTNPNIRRAQIMDAFYEMQERRTNNQGYMTMEDEIEIFKLPDPIDPHQIHSNQSDILDVFSKKREQHIKPKYELK